MSAILGKIQKIFQLLAEKFGLDLANTPDLIGKIGELLSWLWRASNLYRIGGGAQAR